MRFSLSPVQSQFIIYTVLVSLLALSRASACTIVYPPPPPRAPGETDAQFSLRYQALVVQLEREEVGSRPQSELRRQAELWRIADQIVLVEEAPLQVEPSRQGPMTARRVPKRSPRTTGKLIAPPIPPLLIPNKTRIPNLNIRSRVVEVRIWLKGTGSDKQLNFTSGTSTCGGFWGPANTRGPLLLFAPLGSIDEESLLGYLEVDKVVDPDIAVALARAQPKQ